MFQKHFTGVMLKLRDIETTVQVDSVKQKYINKYKENSLFTFFQIKIYNFHFDKHNVFSTEMLMLCEEIKVKK